MNMKLAKDLENNLYSLINNSGLSLDTAFYVLKSVYLDLKSSFDIYLLSNEENANVSNSTIQPVTVDTSADNTIIAD